jgi:excisionase family DNA binding protein
MEKHVMPRKLLTKAEAAKRYHCSIRSIEQVIHDGEIDAYRTGKVLIDEENGDKWFLSSKKIQPVRRQGRPRKEVKVNWPK